MGPMDDGYTIGELSRRPDVSVRTIRFWSDRGVVPDQAQFGSASERPHCPRLVAQHPHAQLVSATGAGHAQCPLDERGGARAAIAAHPVLAEGGGQLERGTGGVECECPLERAWRFSCSRSSRCRCPLRSAPRSAWAVAWRRASARKKR
jgi:hypothetical protein